MTDSETFYTSILDLFDDGDEQDEVKNLLAWWNRSVRVSYCLTWPAAHINVACSQIFPTHSTAQRPITTGSALASIRARRVALNLLPQPIATVPT